MKSVSEGIWELIQEHAGRRGMVNMRRLGNDLGNLSIEWVDVQSIIRNIRDAGLIWFWGKQMVVVRPFYCWTCGRRVDERASEHMGECLRVQRKVAGYRVHCGG